MSNIILNNNNYRLIENIDNCFSLDDVKEKVTDYFNDFDYIFGDIAYDKVRLKGFYDSSNKKVKKINDIALLDDYKSNFCNYGSRTFLLKKIK